MIQLELNYSPFPYQADIHKSDTRFKLIVAGRRAGKTQLALQETIKHCLTTPGAVAWWIAPTYRDAREVGWEEFLLHADILKPALRYMNVSILKVEFINGAKLYFKGSDKPDSLRGRGLTWCVMDECAFCHEDVWKKAVRPALSDKQGRAILISTPNGHNWFRTQYQYALKPSNPAWEAVHFPSSVNPLLTEADIEEAMHDLSEMDFRQEYLAEFVTKAGLIYSEFSPFNIVEASAFKFDKDRHDCYLGMDFGFANPTAIAFMAVDRGTGHVTQFDELYVERTPIDQIVDQIFFKLSINKATMPVAVHTDPAGNAEELSSGISPVDFMRDKGFTVINRGTNVAPGLALVRSYVKNASGQRRYLITSNCTETIRSMYGYSYKLGPNKIPTEEPDKDNKHDHACDGVRYFFVNHFDYNKFVARNLVQSPYSNVSKRGTILKHCGMCHKPFTSSTPKGMPPLVCNNCSEENL
jgi:phage terminase large subunit